MVFIQFSYGFGDNSTVQFLKDQDMPSIIFPSCFDRFISVPVPVEKSCQEATEVKEKAVDKVPLPVTNLGTPRVRKRQNVGPRLDSELSWVISLDITLGFKW